MRPARELLLDMGLDPDEAIRVSEELKSYHRKPRNPDICVCGHPMARHTEIEGRPGEWTCQPSRMYCPCDHARAVLRVEDTRMFLRKTKGPKFEHALMLGLTQLITAGKEAEWIDDPRTCDKCGTRCDPFPVPLTRSNSIAYEASSRNALLCQICYEEM